MPFYEYQCKNCGHALEAMQKINDAPLKKCPECGKQQLTRLMSAPVFRLKGGGWYETDFKGDQDNKRNLADRPEADSAKDDAKPAAEAKDSKDAKPADGVKPAEKADKPADKAADKPADKPAVRAANPSSGAGSSRRGTAVASKPSAKPAAKPAKAAKKPVKKPATKSKKR